MGIIEFFGLRPARHAEPVEVEMQVFPGGAGLRPLDDADQRQLDTARRTLEAAAVTDDDDRAIAQLARAVLELQDVVRQDHPRVAALTREIDEERDARTTAKREAAALGEAVVQDADRWRDGWTDWSNDEADADDDDEEARDQRLGKLGDFLADLRAGLERHEATRQGLRGRAGEASLVGADQALSQARLTLQAATATWQTLDAARRQAAKRDDLQSALNVCEIELKEALGDRLPPEFGTLSKQAEEVLAELVTPDKLSPTAAAGRADELAKALGALSRRVIHEHNLALRDRLQQRLQAALARARKAQAGPDDEALDEARSLIDALGEQAYILRPVAIEKALYDIEQAAHYAEQTEATLRDKLPIAEDAKARHGKVPTATTLEALLERMVPGKLENLGPGPLGVASPGYAGSAWPKVEVRSTEGKFRFVPTDARESGAHTCAITPIGAHDIGVIAGVGKGTATVAIGEDLFTFKGLTGTTSPKWIDCMLQRGVTKEAYREVELRELEHLVDFSYAFEISAGRLAKAVNSLGSRVFDSQDEALAALIDSLADARALIPADPRQPQEWERRIREVVQELADFSSERDSSGTHSPAGNVARQAGQAVVIEPVFKSASLDTTKIISLARVDAVFGGLDESRDGGGDAWALNSVKHTKEQVGADFCDAMDGTELITDYVPPGTAVTIQAKPSGSQVWVRATAGAVKVAGYGELKEQTPVYFKMSTKNLA